MSTGSVRSHWSGCEHSHHECALRKIQSQAETIERLEAENADLKVKVAELEREMAGTSLWSDDITHERDRLEARLAQMTEFRDEVREAYRREAADRAALKAQARKAFEAVTDDPAVLLMGTVRELHALAKLLGDD